MYGDVFLNSKVYLFDIQHLVFTHICLHLELIITDMI